MPEPNEVQAAAERVRRIRSGEMYLDVYGIQCIGGGHLRRDEEVIIDAYLAQRPGDETTVVDEAWLRSVGGVYKYDGETIDEDYIGWSTNRGCEIGPSIAIHLPDMNLVLEGTHVPGVFFKTRSAVLRLLEALGIPHNPKAKE